MRRLVAFSVIIIAVIAIFSIVIWYTLTNDKVNGNVIKKPANVKDIEFVILESFPVQVNVIIRGEYPDSCTTLDKITSVREGATFIVDIITRRPSNAICAQVITPFEKVIALDVSGLKKGIYKVDVNGVKEKFELQTDNILQDVGFLEGKVEIGPLCPVEPCNLTKDQIAQAYEARKLIVHRPDNYSTVSIVSLDGTGNYRIILSPGSYIIDINRVGIDLSSDVPKEVIIESGKTVRFDIRIDTGIR